MFATKYLLPALAVVGFAAAQSSICSQATATINSQADATALASSCSTVNGDISIGSTITGAISLDGIQQIKGDLSCIGAVNMTGLSGKDLNSIGGTMTLTSLTILSTLSFPSLTSVKSIQWAHLNGLQQLTFTQGISTADAIMITDTQLNSLDGINLQTVQSMDINNNPYLHLLSTQVANITQSLTIDANAQDLKVEFPNLIFAYNMTLRNISSISIPSLASVNTTLGFYGDYLTSVMAPNLTFVGGDLALIANAELTNISFPALVTVGGGVTIANNSALMTIDGFSSLKTTGAINMSGNFSTVTLPALADCKGTFNMQSSGNISCDPFQQDANSKVIKGAYFCASGSTNVQSSATSTGSTTGSSASPTSTKGAAPFTSVDMPTVVGFSTFIGALVQMLL